MKKLLFFICMGFLALTSCEKDPDFSKLDAEPAVYTNYAEKTNFASYDTFYVPDSIMEVTSYKCETWNDKNSKKIIDYVVHLMESRGYTRTFSREEADLGILLSHIKEINIVYGSWWDYWFPFIDPWWIDWYYPVTVSYAYQTNSFIMDMADMKDKRTVLPGEKKPRLHIVWCSQIDAFRFDAQSIKAGIDQAFKQSPYVKK